MRARLPALTALLCLAIPAAADAAGTLTVNGFALARGAAVSGQPSWREGGFGPLLLGTADPDDEDAYGLAELSLGLDWQISPAFGAFFHGVGRAEPDRASGRALGVVEAYLHAGFATGQRGRLRLRLGHFILPTSRENVELLWSSPYTLTFSALNSWIGEEMRLTGLFAEESLALGERDELRLAASAFGGNDTTGTLLAWRGWAMHDRLTGFGEIVPLPPLASLAPGGGFEVQRDDGTQPFGSDLDGRLGWAASLRWQRRDRALLQWTHFDNRADRALHGGDEYAWATELDLFAAELHPGGGWTLLGELLTGATGMGFRGAPYVQADVEAAYLLASWQTRGARLSLRYDTFRTRDRDRFRAGDNNDGDGNAWTLALLWDLRPTLRLGVELLRLSARVSAEVEITLVFEEGRVSGSAGCNTYTAKRREHRVRRADDWPRCGDPDDVSRRCYGVRGSVRGGARQGAPDRSRRRTARADLGGGGRRGRPLVHRRRRRALRGLARVL